MIEKKKIYYARTYRRLRNDKLVSFVYVCLVMVPCLILYILNISNLSELMSWAAVKILAAYIPGIPIQIVESELPILGEINIVDLPTTYPDFTTILINLAILIVFFTVINTGVRRGRPVSIFLTIIMLTHLINCIYFIFGMNYFPYSAFQYSDLYMKQQIGLWMIFIILSGLVTGFLGTKGAVYKLSAFFGIMAYSFVFGFVRYIVFLYILEEWSILYMALMFFVLGPFFDFMYLVWIYGVFINKMGDVYNSASGREEWIWS